MKWRDGTRCVVAVDPSLLPTGMTFGRQRRWHPVGPRIKSGDDDARLHEASLLKPDVEPLEGVLSYLLRN